MLTVLKWLLTTGAAAAAVGATLWFCRGWIGAWLSSSVQHTYDAKLEALRAELRAKEQQFDASSRARQAEVAALREGALAAAVSRNSARYQKTVEAVDQIWGAVIELNAASMSAKWLETIKFDECCDSIEHDGKLQAFFGTFVDLSGGSDWKAEKNAEHCRPYVSELVWALFQAYQTVVVSAHIMLRSLARGVDARKFFKFDAANEALKVALPHYTQLLDDRGYAAHGMLLGELRDKILDALRGVLEGREEDSAAVAQAASILKAVAKAQSELEPRSPSSF